MSDVFCAIIGDELINPIVGGLYTYYKDELLGGFVVMFPSKPSSYYKAALRQLLEFGLFHGDPHAGNIFAMDDGRWHWLKDTVLKTVVVLEVFRQSDLDQVVC